MTDSGFRLVIVSANRDKAAEIISILSGALRGEVELIERPLTIPEVEETGASLEENARLKAVAISSATGMAAVADDTGLEVEALGGSPGVFSARFAGEHATYAHNVAKLLAALGQRTDREARFRTVALAVFPDGTEVLAEGEVTGRIAEAARGTAGFGYDPLFIPDEGDGRTFAELSAAEKQEISHRGRAFRALAQRLAELDRRTPDGPGGASLPSISPSGPR